MVLDKLIAAATSSAYTWQQSSWKGGDPSIVYLDGVAPPIRNMNRPSEVEDNKRMSGCAENSNQYTAAPRPATKMQNLHHQQLLQTIREDDSESRGENPTVAYRPERLSTSSSCSTGSWVSSSGSTSSGFSGSNSCSSSDEEPFPNSEDCGGLNKKYRQRKLGCHGRSPLNRNTSWLAQLECSVVASSKLTSMTLQTKLDDDQHSTDGSESMSRKSSVESVISHEQPTMSEEVLANSSPSGKSPLIPLPEEESLDPANLSKEESKGSGSDSSTLSSNPSTNSLELKNGPCNNNNSLPRQVSIAELELLKRLEEQNRLIETDAKSLNSLQSGHSRRNSDASQISVTSGSSFPEREESTEEDLWTLWGKIINEWDSAAKRKLPHVKELVRRGIPHHFRGVAWPLLCGAHESLDKPRYAEYMKTQSAHEKVIRRDIARTYPEHEFFKKKDGVGQEALFNVMKAYSIHDREVGYCQGSAFIVGLLLMQMPEEEAFCVLVKLMQEYRMREMFKPSMAELGLCMYQLEVLVQEHIPDLYAHFQSQSIHTNLYASSWFLTIFSTSVPIALACRIMDCFLADGIEVIFRLALALLLIGRSELLVQDMEGVIRYFQRDMPTKFETDPETVFNLAFSLKINQKKMKKLEKEYTTMKTKEKEDEIELRRLRTENRLLRQRVDLLEQESSNLADRLIQGQVTRAEVEESTFAIKRELAAVKQHDLDTNSQLDEAKERIRKLSAIIEDPEKLSSKEDISLKSEVIKQKEEMIHCLQDELIKERLREAENEEKIRDLHQKVADLEADMKKMRDAVPENDVASLQEELAAAKLREAEANLALKELRSKVSELSAMWQKHIKRAEGEANGDSLGVMAAPSTPKKLLGSLLEGGKAAEAAKLEEELLTSRMSEVEGQADLKEQKLKVMELETQNHVIANQLKRQSDEVSRLREAMEKKAEIEGTLQQQVKEAKRKYADLEGRMKEDLMMARIRDAENTQCVAELTQKISSLEYKNQEMLTEGDLATSMDQSYKMRELQDKIASLRAQVTRLSLFNSKLSQSLSLHNLASSFSSEGSSPSHTPTRESPSPATSQSSLKINLSTSLQALN